MPLPNWLLALENAVKGAPLSARDMAQGMGTAPSEGAARFGSNFLPVVGDAAGLAQDAEMFYSDPASRTILNGLMSAAGVFPFVPPASSGRAARELLIESPVPGTYWASIGDRQVASLNLNDDLEHVTSVYVEPEFRRQGIASALYDRAESDIGRKLPRSPTHLTEDGVAFRNARDARRGRRD